MGVGLFEGRQERKAWRAALETARRAKAVGNFDQVRRSIGAALTLRSAVPKAWVADLQTELTQFEAASYGRPAVLFAALRLESSLDPDLTARWHAALSQAEVGASAVSGNPDNVDLDPIVQGLRSALDLDPEIPWEMKEIDVPPVWEGFLRAAQLAAARGYAQTSLEALQSALTLAEMLSPQRSSELSLMAAAIGRDLRGDGRRVMRDRFKELSRTARSAETRVSDQPPSTPAEGAVVERPQMPPPANPVSPGSPLPTLVARAVGDRRFAEASRLLQKASEQELRASVPAPTRALPGLGPWGTVLSELGLSAPPQPWDRSQTDKVRIRWASSLSRPSLICVVITDDQRARLIVRDSSADVEGGLASTAIQLSGSTEECVAWGRRILGDRRLYLALVDVAAAWSPGTTPAKIAEFVNGMTMPARSLVDALSVDSEPLRMPVRPEEYLGLANRLEELVLSGLGLDDSAVAVLREFLLQAPLTAGTWGPFKGIIKALEARTDDLPGAFGAALARTTCLPASALPPSDAALSMVLPGEVGGQRTLAYLDRRGRRVLRTLSWRAPSEYATVVLAFLQGVDGLLGQGHQVRRREALEFSLYGAVRPVAPHMRFPRPPPVPQRHQQRWDPAPEAWNRNSAEVSALLAHTTTRSDIATWAFQVLTDLGAEVPLIHAEPALLSGNSDFQRLGFAALAEDPSAVNSLSSEALATLIAHMPMDESAVLLAGSLPGDRLESAFEYLLVTPDKIPHLVLTATEQKRVALLATQMASEPVPVQLSSAARVAVVKAALVLGESWDLTPVAVGLSLEQLADLREEVGSLPATDTVRWLDEAIVRAADDSSWQTYSLADRWVGLSDPDLSRLGWRLADRYFGDDVLFLRLLQAPVASPVASPAAVARCVSSLAASGSSSRTRVVLEWWAQTADQRQWEESVPAIDRALADNPQVWSNLWPLLSDKVDLSASQRLRELPSLPQGMVESVTPAAIAALDERQTDALWSFLTAHPQRFGADDAFALAVTVYPNAVLCSAAISILRSQNRIKELWLPLIESGLPPAVAAGEQHLRSLNDKDTLRASMLDLLDSGNRDARTLAMTLLSDGDVDLSWTEVLDEMTEHRDPRIWREVADRLTDVGNVELLHAFERRVLTTRREGRAAKTLVQEHLTSARDSESAAAAVDVLLAMAQGDIPRDREWAVSQLLALAESGQSIPGLDVIDQAS